jgi:hypothetical protein
VPGVAIYLDENGDARVAAGVRRPGLLVHTAADAGALGFGDQEQPHWATALKAALVTHDPDLISSPTRPPERGDTTTASSSSAWRASTSASWDAGSACWPLPSIATR